MKEKKICLLIYLSFIVTMSFLFVNLDVLVGQLVRTEINDLQVVDFKTYEAMAKDVVYVEGNTIQFGTDDFETLSLEGTCCVCTEKENLNKTVTVLLKSKDICYASERPSVLGDVPAGAVSPPIKINHGYTRDISLLPIKNGVYELWLFDWENEENYGLIFLDIWIVKDRQGIRMKERTVNVDLKEKLYSEANWCLDYVHKERGGLSFSGWAFQENVETQGQTVYLKLSTSAETRYIECYFVKDKGVSLYFESDKYDYSRFLGYADQAWIGNGPLEISLILKNKNGFHTGKQIYCWNPVEKKQLQSVLIEYPLLRTCPFAQEEVQPAFGSLDLVQKRGGQVNFMGWIAAENKESKTQDVYLEIQTENGPYYVKCTQEVRTGVGDVMGNRLYDYSGYACQIKTEDIPIEGVSFRIFICNGGQVYTDGQSHYFDVSTGEYS